MSDDQIGQTFKGPGGMTWRVTGELGQYYLTETGKGKTLKKSCINKGLLDNQLRRQSDEA